MTTQETLCECGQPLSEHDHVAVPQAVVDFVGWLQVAGNRTLDAVAGAAEFAADFGTEPEIEIALVMRTRWPEGSGKETGWIVERNFPDLAVLAKFLDDAAESARNMPRHPSHVSYPVIDPNTGIRADADMGQPEESER